MAYIGDTHKETLAKLRKPIRWISEIETEDKTLDKFDLSHPWVQERIHYFAKDTTENILRNMTDFQISPKRSDRNYSGSLERSIHWTIVNNAGGNAWLVEFYYLFYGRYLEMSASGWLNPKYGPITAGSVPPMTDRGGVQVGKRPWKAKPFITSEIRRQAKRLATRLSAQFAYAGGMKIFHTFVTGKSMAEREKEIQAHSTDFWDFIKGQMDGVEVTLL